MRLWRLLCATGLVWARIASGAPIQNPSFESFDDAMRPAGWTYVADGTPDAQGVVSADWVTDGSWAFKISSPTENTWGTHVGVAQDVDFTGLLNIVFDARISVQAGSGCYLDLLIYDGPYILTYWSRSETGTWLDQSVDVSHISGVHRIEFRYSWGAPFNGPATAYVDNVRVHEGTVSAHPATWGSLKRLYRK
jgi:hypothetical protein